MESVFDIPPSTKAISRADLQQRSRTNSPSPSADDERAQILHTRLSALYGDAFNNNVTSISSGSGPDPATVDEEDASPGDGFEFRLFAASTLPTICLADAEDEEVGEGGFVVKERDPSFYFWSPKEESWDRGRFEEVAVSGEDVRAWSRRRAWGLEVPWRVTVLGSGSAGAGVKKDERAAEIEGKKKKLGKKRRILLRIRKRIGEEAREKEAKIGAEKEEREKEKRIRRNREKKIKRKAKEKAEKALKLGAGEAAQDVLTML